MSFFAPSLSLHPPSTGVTFAPCLEAWRFIITLASSTKSSEVSILKLEQLIRVFLLKLNSVDSLSQLQSTNVQEFC